MDEVLGSNTLGKDGQEKENSESIHIRELPAETVVKTEM
jgi:hypothetical protein